MLPEFPEIGIEKIDVHENPSAMLDLGIKRFPALAYGDRSLSVLFLTKRKIRRFLSRL